MKKLLFLLLVSSGTLSAQTDSSTVELTGFIDGYYFYDFNEPEEGLFTGIQPGRHNEFNVNIAMIRARYSSNRARATVALQSGTYADINYAAEPSDIIAIINEANAGIRIGKKNWLDFGIMPMYFGYESQFSIERELYSAAMNTDFTPYYSMGVKWTTDFSEKWSVTANVTNGWQNIFETNDNKAVGISVTYRPNEDIELLYGNFYGNLGTNEDEDFLFYNNFYIRWNTSPKLRMIFTLDYGSFDPVGSDDLLFSKIIAEYLVNPKYSVSFRQEYLWDNGANVFAGTQQPQNINSTTLNLNYKPIEQAALRLEVKYFSADDDVFVIANEQVVQLPDNSTTVIPRERVSDSFLIGLSLAVQFSKEWKF